MMGRQDEPGHLFYRFNLERHIPADHLLRQIDAVLDLGEIRRSLAPHYASTGRPSVDPELMIRMLLLGYAFAIRSERRLCDEARASHAADLAVVRQAASLTRSALQRASRTSSKSASV